MSDLVKSIRKLKCPVCQSSGRALYSDLRDGLFGASGFWTMRSCDSAVCGTAWLDPYPDPEDIHLAYAAYYTHGEDAAVDGGTSRKRASGWHRFLRKLFLRRLKKISAMAEKGYRASVFQDPTVKHSSSSHWKKYLFYCFPFRRADTDFSFMYLPVLPGKRLLEVGCGSGWMLSLMQSRGWRAEGVDFDEKAVTYARAQGLQVGLGDLRAQNYAAQSFDVIIGSHLIEHLYDPGDFLRECRRLLVENGRLVLVTPNLDSLGHKVFKRNWRGLEPPRHLQLFTGNSIAELSRRAGFANCEIRFSMRDAHHLFQASRNLTVLGEHRHGAAAPLWRRCWTRGLQAFEYLLMKVKPSLGEELVVILS